MFAGAASAPYETPGPVTEADVARHPSAWQPSLFGLGDPGVDPGFTGLHRTWLDDASWIDHLPRWLTGADHVFSELVARLRWHQRVVRMYDRMVDEPRLTWWWADGASAAAGTDSAASGPVPLPVLDDARRALTRRYGVVFDSIGCNYYRDGRDSVAWHGDRLRHQHEDSTIAIVSVGAPRPFLVRPLGGGPSRGWLLGQGDLLVMGGACQHDWEHTVPKVAHAGPRISITYRHGLPPP